MTTSTILRPQNLTSPDRRIAGHTRPGGYREPAAATSPHRVAVLASSEETRGFEDDLRRAGYTVDYAADTQPKPDVVLINLLAGWSNLVLKPGDSPSSAARIALVREAQLPIVARAHGDFDDFIVFPVQPKEAAARIARAIARNAARQPSRIVNAGDIRLDRARFEVRRGERQVHLTFKEFELLDYLITNLGNVVSRDELLRDVWGDESFGSHRSVDVLVRRLRVKLQDEEHALIQTIRTVGYRLWADDPDLGTVSLRSGA